MSKTVTTTTTTTTTNTSSTNTTKPATTTTVVSPTPVKNTTTPAAPTSASGPTAPGDWFGTLIGWLWTYFWITLWSSFIAWWWIPITGILFGDWTQFYMVFTSYSSSFGGLVKSYS